MSKYLATREKFRKRAQIAKARKSFTDYCVYVSRGEFTIGRPQAILGKEIDAWIKSPEPYNLAVIEPPRHGKSEMCSRYLPGYLFGLNPDDQILAASYGKDLIESMSRAAQRIMMSEEYAEVFPETRLAVRGERRDDNAIKRGDEFTVIGKKGHYKCGGVGGQFTGFGAHWGLIDDPIKGRKEAESATIRNTLKQWYQADFRTRLMKNGRMLLAATRWHNDDLTGHVLKTMDLDPDADHWKVVWLPATAEGGKYLHPDDDREIGEALWPEMFDEKALKKIKATGNVQIGVYGGSYDWNALYQGRPEPPGGSKIKRGNIRIVKSAPDGLTWCRFWDLAVTEKTTADYTASCQLSIDSNLRVWVKNVIHFQREWPTVRRTMKMILKQEKCVTGVEAVGTQTGFIQDLQQDAELMGLDLADLIVAQGVDADKLTRALPWIARTEEGLFCIVDGPNVTETVDELCEFTGHDDPHDDLIDMISGAYRMQSESFEAESVVF